MSEFAGDTSRRLKLDLTDASEARLIVNVSSAGAFSAVIRAQYSTNQSTWNYLDGASGPSVSIASSGLKVSGWTTLAAGAKADVYLRIVGDDGNGFSDPQFGLIHLQVR